MRKLFALVMILVLVITPSLVLVPKSEAVTSTACAYAKYNPGLAIACFYEIMMELWNPLDWGDNPSSTFVIQEGNNHGSDRIPGDGDDIAGGK